MKNANVLLVEDQLFARKAVRERLSATSHEIVREATTLDEALAAVDDIAEERLPCDVVILDGDVNPSISDLLHKPVGYGAIRVAARIRELDLNLRLIGFSANTMEDLGVTVDIDLTKSGLSGLGEALESF